MKILIVVDMQNDFINGALGTKEAEGIVDSVAKKITDFDGMVLFTKDTHLANYLETQEGKNLPVMHCIKGTDGWQLAPQILEAAGENAIVFEKPCFGSKKLAKYLKKYSKEDPIEEITLVGLCTDICVISNAMIIKSYLPEVPVHVISDLCAGVTPESHQNALNAMKVCQIIID